MTAKHAPSTGGSSGCRWSIDLILRLAVFELLETPETPRSVVINEALELARTFSTEAAVKFINGVLDGVGREIARRARANGRTHRPMSQRQSS